MKQNITDNITVDMLDNYNYITCTGTGTSINGYELQPYTQELFTFKMLDNIIYGNGTCIITSTYSRIDYINESPFLLPLILTGFLFIYFFKKGYTED